MPPESSQGCQGRYVFQPTVGTPPERYVFETPFTNAAKRFKKTKSGVHLMHEVMKRLEPCWRRLKSAHLCATVPLPEKKAAKVA